VTFVRLDVEGKINLDESRRVLSGVAKACVDRGVNWRDAGSPRSAGRPLDITEIYTLVWGL